MSACPTVERLELHLAGGDDPEIARHLERCAACRALAEEVRSNLAIAERLASHGLGGPAGGVRHQALPGLVLGPPLHAGAQGVVYRARQSATERDVAVKVLHGCAGDERTARRLEREVELVARLDHPGIVPVIDRGVTEDGRWFLVLPLVEGEQLDAWAARRRDANARGLGWTREVVRLVAGIADAVAHAHLRGVLHRDLKPANVLVDDDSRPHVLDFGVARALDPSDASLTRDGAFVGTLRYAAPEQTLGRPDAVDARADVHALGTILHELLDERLPWDLPEDALAAASVIRSVPARRPCNPRAPVDRDLAAILAAALAKEPARRYQSAGALRDDLRRWLGREPVLARGDGAAYRVASWVRRHRSASTLAAVVAIAATAMVAQQIVQAGRLRVESAKLRQTLLFLEDTVGSAAVGDDGGALRVDALLDEAVLWIDLALKDQPIVAASVRTTLANGYRGLGRTEEADRLLAAAAADAGALDASDRARLESAIGLLRLDQKRFDDAHVHLRRALELRRSAFGRDSFEETLALGNLARAEEARGHPEAARALLEQSLAARRELLGELHPDVAMAWFQLGALLDRRGDAVGARAAHARALAIREAVLDPRHPDLARSRAAVRGPE